MDLSPQTLQAIETLIPRYPESRSAVLPILHLIQEEQGYISTEVIDWMAQRLQLAPIHIYEVVTFYPMFTQKRVGTTHVKVCRTLSCALRGSHALCKGLEAKLHCPVGSTTPDGAFTLEFVECLANCHGAPVVQINETLHENCTVDAVHALCQQSHST